MSIDKEALEKAWDAFSERAPKTAGCLSALEAAILAYLAAAPITEEDVEAGARAAWITGSDWDARETFGGLPPYAQDLWRDRARACLQAVRDRRK